MEQWKEVTEFNGVYLASTLGRIKNSKTDNILKGRVNRDGYREYCLCFKGKQYHRQGQILIWDTFGDSLRNGRILVVDHIDNDKLNNEFSNLQLVTHRINTIKDKNNSSGYPGVYIESSKIIARISVNYKRIHIGCFKSKEEAYACYLECCNLASQNLLTRELLFKLRIKRKQEKINLLDLLKNETN